MHKQKFVLGKIPNGVFRELFKYVEPLEFSNEQLLEKKDQWVKILAKDKEKVARYVARILE